MEKIGYFHILIRSRLKQQTSLFNVPKEINEMRNLDEYELCWIYALLGNNRASMSNASRVDIDLYLFFCCTLRAGRSVGPDGFGGRTLYHKIRLALQND